ncbi:hypothetical protein Ddc_16101 [Ditylenchus destructor]|nr:hypothetical protein Ddc_16101 [Ditylenchus destructor]
MCPRVCKCVLRRLKLLASLGWRSPFTLSQEGDSTDYVSVDKFCDTPHEYQEPLQFPGWEWYNDDPDNLGLNKDYQHRIVIQTHNLNCNLESYPVFFDCYFDYLGVPNQNRSESCEKTGSHLKEIPLHPIYKFVQYLTQCNLDTNDCKGTNQDYSLAHQPEPTDKPTIKVINKNAKLKVLWQDYYWNTIVASKDSKRFTIFIERHDKLKGIQFIKAVQEGNKILICGQEFHGSRFAAFARNNRIEDTYCLNFTYKFKWWKDTSSEGYFKSGEEPTIIYDR